MLEVLFTNHNKDEETSFPDVLQLRRTAVQAAVHALEVAQGHDKHLMWVIYKVSQKRRAFLKNQKYS